MGNVVRQIRDTRMKWLFVGLFVLAIVTTLVLVATVFGLGMLGLWAAAGVAGSFGLVLTLVYRRLYRLNRPRASLKPGEVACPKCRSLQTDQVEEEPEVGRLQTVWVCFRCDHRWDLRVR